jgi:hypothetical protein
MRQIITINQVGNFKTNNMTQQTAVEWLVEQIKSDQNEKALSPNEWMQVIEQANKMFEEQIVQTYNDGYKDGQSDLDSSKDISEFSNAKLYYNEIYKKICR